MEIVQKLYDWFLFPMAGWMAWLSIKVFNNEKELAINSQSDIASGELIKSFESKIDTLISDVNQIKVDVAVLKAQKDGIS